MIQKTLWSKINLNLRGLSKQTCEVASYALWIFSKDVRGDKSIFSFSDIFQFIFVLSQQEQIG